jgi:hypothetical protein
MTADYRRKIAHAKWKYELGRMNLPLVFPPPERTPILDLHTQIKVLHEDQAAIERALSVLDPAIDPMIIKVKKVIRRFR